MDSENFIFFHIVRIRLIQKSTKLEKNNLFVRDSQP